jgi:hypothetical protein
MDHDSAAGELDGGDHVGIGARRNAHAGGSDRDFGLQSLTPQDQSSLAFAAGLPD